MKNVLKRFKLFQWGVSLLGGTEPVVAEVLPEPVVADKKNHTKEMHAYHKLKFAIADAVRENANPITVSLGGCDYYDINGVEITAGTPKSDFHLTNTKGEPVVWLSYKAGLKASSFHQWGGMSLKKEPDIYNHEETRGFIHDVQVKYPNGIPKATSVYRKINDEQIKMMAVYGNKYNTEWSSEQNVNAVLHGNISLTHNGGVYVLSASHIHINGDTVVGEFEPVFMAIYKGDRSDFGIKGARLVTMPISGRKAKELTQD